MGFLAQKIIPYILLYKYWALFVLTFLSSAALPVPAGTLLVASSAFASQGIFNIGVLLIVAIIANILGDHLLYWVARIYGEPFFRSFGFTRKILYSKDFTLIRSKIKQHPGAIIFVSRFEVIATLAVNAVCGLSGVSYRKYILHEIPGVVAGVFVYGTIGYLFGDGWQRINKVIGNFSLIVFFIIAICVIVLWKKIMDKWSTQSIINE